MNVDEYDSNRVHLAIDKSGKKVVDNFNSLIMAGSGFGKSIASEAFIEEMHKKGYIIIILNDTAKDKYETAFNMFLPQEKYHKNILRRIGKKESAKKMKLYHPFTFNFPKRLMPEHTLFTIPLQSLTREELSFLLETNSDTNEIKLMMESLPRLKKNEGIPHLMQIIEENIKTDQELIGTKSIQKPKKPYYTTTTSAGTKTNLEQIQSSFNQFIDNYILTSNDCFLNLNVEEILKDQEHYHMLVTKHITDKKMKYFVILSFLKRIMENIEKSKYPICFLIEEVANLCPRNSKGYQEYLATHFLGELLTWRAKGRGISSVSTTQIITELSDEIKVGFNETFIGRMGSIKDIGNLSKELKLKKNVSDELANLKLNRYFRLASLSDSEYPIYIWFPSSCHAEAFYHFDEMYKYHHDIYPVTYPMFNYSDTIKQMKELRESIDVDAEEKALKLYKERKKIAEKLLEERQKKAEEKAKEETQKIEKTEIKNLTKLEIQKRIYDMKLTAHKMGKDISWYTIAEEIGKIQGKPIDRKTVAKYHKEYSEQQFSKDEFASLDSVSQ